MADNGGMKEVIYGLGAAIAGLALPLAGWAHRTLWTHNDRIRDQDGRINVLASQVQDINKRAEERHADLKDDLKELKDMMRHQ